MSIYHTTGIIIPSQSTTKHPNDNKYQFKTIRKLYLTFKMIGGNGAPIDSLSIRDQNYIYQYKNKKHYQSGQKKKRAKIEPKRTNAKIKFMFSVSRASERVFLCDIKGT